MAAQNVTLTGLYEDMHPGGFPAFLRGKMMANFQIWGDFPVKKLGLNKCSNSCHVLGPGERWGDIIWPRGDLNAHLEDGLVEVLLSQGSAAALFCSRGFQRQFQLSGAVPFLFIEA